MKPDPQNLPVILLIETSPVVPASIAFARSARSTPLDERAFEQMVLGVSTRRYTRSLEPLPEEIEVRGISKSAISERLVIAPNAGWWS